MTHYFDDKDEHYAKAELLRINEYLSCEVLLIGGLAVRQYYGGRSSRDLDLVCGLKQQKELQKKAYPSQEYEMEERQTDLRPEIIYKNLKLGYRVFLGPKILERPPYKFINYNDFMEFSIPFKYDEKYADKVKVPAAHVIAYSKLLSFIDRHNHQKGEQDLEDFANVTNHQTFSLNRFIAFAEKAKAVDHIHKFFSENKLKEREANILRVCSPVRFQMIFPLSLIEKTPSSIDTNGNAKSLIDSINELSNSPIVKELGSFFETVKDLQFSTDVIRRNWNIQINYDVDKLDKGIIIETIDWEYELANIRSYPVKHKITLTHSTDTENGCITKIFTSLPGGRREEITFLEQRHIKKGHHYKKDETVINIEPGVAYYVTLYYKNTWFVNPSHPFILNATTSKEPCLNCRIRFTIPQGMRVSVLNREIIDPHLINNVYDVRLPKPLLAEQKIEYVLEKNDTR